MAVQTIDLRSARCAVDVAGATRQRTELQSLIHDPVVRRRAEHELLRSRPELDRVGAGSFAVAGELVAVAGPDQRGVQDLQRSGFTLLARRGPLIRLARVGAPMGEVLAAVESLRRIGVIASPNYVSAVAGGGAVGKGILGLATAQPTSVRLGPRPIDDRRGLGVRVAVVDTGIDPKAVRAPDGWLDGIDVHPGPGGNCDALDAVPEPDGELDPGAGHGTFVAGLIRQFSPSSAVTAVKALESDGVGTDWSVAEALLDLAEGDQSYDLVNLSLACVLGDIAAPTGIVAAIDSLVERHPDTVIVAAAGNDGSTEPTWPGAHKSVLCVGSSSGSQPAEYSNRGYWVDFSIPSEGVVSTYVQGRRTVPATQEGAEPEHLVYDGEYASWSGTSFAAPQVTGMLADLISQGLRPAQAVAKLRHRSTPSSEAGRVIG